MDSAAIDVTKRMVELTIILGLPILGTALVVGLVVSILQAVTQINEMTLTFVPKIVAVALAAVLFTKWMLAIIMGFTVEIFNAIPLYMR